jgi:CubicO group peptidase (beta-lactamase class C family)
VPFQPASLGTNAGLRREVFLNIPGATLADLTNHARFPGQPDVVDTLPAFETPTDAADNYGVRVRGYIVPPTHGTYRFYLSANGQAALFLSFDEHAEHKRLVAFEPVGNGAREWSNGVNQVSRGTPATNVSGAISLVGGQAYYVEVLMKAGVGSDNLGVAWQVPPSGAAPANGSAPIGAPSLALAPSTNSLPTTGEAVPELAVLDFEMLKYLRDAGVNSGVLSVMRDGRLVFHRGYGWQDKLRTRAILPTARFRFASNVKGMTAAAAKQVMARGLLQTNLAIFPYLGLQSFNGVPGDARLNQITLYQCLNHQSGWDRTAVPDPIGQTVLISEAMGLDHPAGRAEHLRHILSQPLQFSPGTRYEYSNIGFIAAGHAIERATGQRWFDVVKKGVLRPWGANGVTPARSQEKLVEPDEPYYWDEPLVPNVLDFPTSAMERGAYGLLYLEAWDAAGGVMGSTEELLTYAQAFVVGGRGNTNPEWYSSYYRMGDRRLLRKGAASDHGGQVLGSKSSLVQRADGVDWAAFYSLSPTGTEPIPENFFNAALDRITVWPGDNATRIELASDSFRVDENEVSITIGVKRTGISTGAVSVAFATLAGTALPDVEYTPVSGTLSFASNEITALITVPLLDDALAESAKSFQVVLSNPTGGAALGTATASVTIEDDDNRLPPSIAITSPLSGVPSPVGSNVYLTALPVDADGTIYSVTYHAGPTWLGEENKPPYTFVWRAPSPGTYLVTARAVDNHGLSATSAPVVVSVGAGLAASAPGTMGREFWNRRPGSALLMLTNYAYFPGLPTGFENLGLFEITSNQGEYYGTKLSGYLHPPVTGLYTFWIAADDQAQLWLSTNDEPVNKRQIAGLVSPTPPRQWTTFPSQQSAAIELQAGQRYYVEALHRESSANDNLAVGWRLPDGTLERPIPGARLSPYLPPGRPFLPDVVVAEGDHGSTQAVFNLTLPATNAQTLTLNYATLDGTATAGSDYTAVNGSVTFLPGELTKSISVPVLGDVLAEPTESFLLRLTDPSNPNANYLARGTIIGDDLFITQHPQGGMPRAGSNVTLSVSGLSARPISYQWRFNGVELLGKTETTLTLPSIEVAQGGEYRVVLSDGIDTVVSESAQLVVLVDPVITTAPISQSVVAGGRVTFSVGFTGNPLPFGIEWRQLATTRASNTVSRFYDFFTLTNAQPSQAGNWRVVVRNLARNGASTENRAFMLTVLADSDSDGLPDAWELAHGFPTNSAANAALDSDGDGVSNAQEYEAGTNPTNALSYLKVDSLALDHAAGARLTFFAMSNKTYAVESRLALEATAWTRVADVTAAASNRVVEITDASVSGTDGQRFYRLATPRYP